MSDTMIKRSVCFDLHSGGQVTHENVIWFSNFPVHFWDKDGSHLPVCIKEQMPVTWHPQYGWKDLNISRAIYTYDPTEWFRNSRSWKPGPLVEDLKALFRWIEGFLVEIPNGIYMHVHEENLPKQGQQMEQL